MSEIEFSFMYSIETEGGPAEHAPLLPLRQARETKGWVEAEEVG